MVWTPSLAPPVRRAVSLEGGDLVLLHQEVEALGVAHDDVVLAGDHGLPVDAAVGYAVDAVTVGVLQVIPELGGEEHRLGGDAAPEQAGAAETVVRVDQGRLEAELRGADGAGIARGAAAENHYVENRVCQEKLQSENRLRNDLILRRRKWSSLSATLGAQWFYQTAAGIADVQISCGRRGSCSNLGGSNLCV